MQERGERHIERMAGVSERAVDHIETMDGPEILNSVDEIEKLDKVARRTFGLDDVPLSGFSRFESRIAPDWRTRGRETRVTDFLPPRQSFAISHAINGVVFPRSDLTAR